MKLKLTVFLLCLSAIMMACKFTSTPEGVYTGTYTAYGFPSESGDDTLHIESIGGNDYNLTLNTTGNPDIFVTNVSLIRQGGLYGDRYTATNYSSYVDTTYGITIYEHDYFNGLKWYVDFSYDVDSPITAIDFDGNRMN